MKNLIPQFIQEQYQKNKSSGTFNAFCMFVDISGFTRMTETLINGGEEGAEILSNTLNGIFNPLINNIYSNSGFINNFEGDAFTAFFPVSDPSDLNANITRVLCCAASCQSVFRRHASQNTRYGDFIFKAKIGLSYGGIEWNICGQSHKVYFFTGTPLEYCATAQQQAQDGEILLDTAIFEMLKPLNKIIIFSRTSHPDYYRLERITCENSATGNESRNSLRGAKEKTLMQFLPTEILHFRKNGEFRNAVSLFISFGGVYATELELFLSLLQAGIAASSGYLNKINFGDKGSSILCIFGAPVAYEDNVERALDFILELQRESMKTPELSGLRIRAGIAYGNVYAGIIGNTERCEYTIIGDTVNLSARFMMRANFGEIWITENIHNLIKKKYDTNFIDEYRFKGKSQKIPVYKLNFKKLTFKKAFTGKFVGRQAELKQSAQYFESVKNGGFGGIVYINGEAGIGKSHFIAELRKTQPDLNWLHLPCDGILQKAFNPFRHLFSHYFEQSPENTEADNKKNFEKIYTWLAEAALEQIWDDDLPGGSPPEFATETLKEFFRLRTVLAGFLGIHYEDSLYDKLDPKLRYENTLYIFREIFKVLSAIKPIVLELEDIHWIESDSIRALQTICRDIENYPILLLGITRKDEVNNKLPLEIPEYDLNLSRYSEMEIREFTIVLLRGRPSERLLEDLKTRTLGNPFFLEQTLLYYHEMGLIQKTEFDQTWDIIGSDAVMPASMNDLLIARIDRLSRQLKNVLQTAAVLGDEFEIKLLLEVMRFEDGALQEMDVLARIKEGETEGVWASLSEIRYIFTHTLLREAVYRMQLKNSLRNLHGLVASTIEQLFAGNFRYYSDLAFHFEKAENIEKTTIYLKKSGVTAEECYENSRAIEFYNRLLAYLENGIEKVEILISQIDLHQLVGKWEEAETYARQAVVISEEINDPHALRKSLTRLGDNLYARAQVGKAVKLYERALHISGELDAQKGISISFGKLGQVFRDKGDFSTAMIYFTSQLEISEILNDPIGVALASGYIGRIICEEFHHNRAMSYFKKQLELFKVADNKQGMAEAYSNIAFVHSEFGQYDEAMESYKHQFQWSELLGDKKNIASAWGGMGDIFTAEAEYVRAQECFIKQRKLCEEMGYIRGQADTYFHSGILYAEIDEYTEAFDFFEKSLDLYKKLKDKIRIALVMGRIGLVYLKTGQPKLAQKHLERQLSSFEKIRDRRGVALALGSFATLYRATNDYDRAFNCLDRAIGILEPLGIYYLLAGFLIEKAELYFLLDEFDKAKQVNNSGYFIAESMRFEEYIFQSCILMAKLNHIGGEHAEAIQQLEALLETSQGQTNKKKRARLYLELWLVTGKDEYKNTVRKLYAGLHIEEPQEIKQAFAQKS